MKAWLTNVQCLYQAIEPLGNWYNVQCFHYLVQSFHCIPNITVPFAIPNLSATFSGSRPTVCNHIRTAKSSFRDETMHKHLHEAERTSSDFLTTQCTTYTFSLSKMRSNLCHVTCILRFVLLYCRHEVHSI